MTLNRMDPAEDDPSRSPPAHSIHPRTRPAQVAGIVGLAAAVAAIGVGTAALIKDSPSTTPSARSTLAELTVPPAAATVPVSDAEIFALLDHPPEFGPLSNPQRLASCLNGLDYPAATRVLGARLVDIAGDAGVLLILPSDRPDTVVGLAVAPNCNSMNTGLLAETTVNHP